MSQEKKHRDSIKWYFPPRNPPPDIGGGVDDKKTLKDYFQPLDPGISPTVDDFQNGSDNSVSQSSVAAVLESPILNSILEDNIHDHSDSEAALVDLTVKTSDDSAKTENPASSEPEAEVVASNASVTLKRKKTPPLIHPPVTKAFNLDRNDLSESSPLNKRFKRDSNACYEGGESESVKDPIPVTRHKTKAFYKQVLPIEPQDLSAKKSPVSKGIKKYFVSKAATGVKSPRKSMDHTFKCDRYRNTDSSNTNLKLTPLKKRKSNVIIEDDSKDDDLDSVYGFVDENVSIVPRTTRFGRKCNASTLEISAEKPSRFSVRRKGSKGDKGKKTANVSPQPFEKPQKPRRGRQNQNSNTNKTVSPSDTHSKYSLRLRNAAISAPETHHSVPSNVRRSSRLCAPNLSPPLPPQPSQSNLPQPPPPISLQHSLEETLPFVPETNKQPDSDFHPVLDSLYVTEVVESDCQGSPIRLKFTRVGQKDSVMPPSAVAPTVPPALPAILQPITFSTVHKKKHSKKKRKKHVKNASTKLSQYQAILKKAVGKPRAASSHLPTADRKEIVVGSRSLRQSSILNRKAIEGAQKADQLKRTRWAQQRIAAPSIPVKRSPRKAPVSSRSSVSDTIPANMKVVEDEVIAHEILEKSAVMNKDAHYSLASSPVAKIDLNDCNVVEENNVNVKILTRSNMKKTDPNDLDDVKDSLIESEKPKRSGVKKHDGHYFHFAEDNLVENQQSKPGRVKKSDQKNTDFVEEPLMETKKPKRSCVKNQDVNYVDVAEDNDFEIETPRSSSRKNKDKDPDFTEQATDNKKAKRNLIKKVDQQDPDFTQESVLTTGKPKRNSTKKNNKKDLAFAEELDVVHGRPKRSTARKTIQNNLEFVDNGDFESEKTKPNLRKNKDTDSDFSEQATDNNKSKRNLVRKSDQHDPDFAEEIIPTVEKQRSNSAKTNNQKDPDVSEHVVNERPKRSTARKIIQNNSDIAEESALVNEKLKPSTVLKNVQKDPNFDEKIVDKRPKRSTGKKDFQDLGVTENNMNKVEKPKRDCVKKFNINYSDEEENFVASVRPRRSCTKRSNIKDPDITEENLIENECPKSILVKKLHGDPEMNGDPVENERPKWSSVKINDQKSSEIAEKGPMEPESKLNLEEVAADDTGIQNRKSKRSCVKKFLNYCDLREENIVENETSKHDEKRDSDSAEDGATQYEKSKRRSVLKKIAPEKALAKSKPTKVTKKTPLKVSHKSAVAPRHSQRKLSLLKKDVDHSDSKEVVGEAGVNLQSQDGIATEKCSVKLAPLFTRNKKKKVLEDEISIVEEKIIKKPETKPNMVLHGKTSIPTLSSADNKSAVVKDEKECDYQHSFDVLLPPIVDFKKVGHFQQKSDAEKLWELSNPTIKCLANDAETYRKKEDTQSILNITSQKTNKPKKKAFIAPKPLSSNVVIQVLKYLEKYSDMIPVKKVFKSYLDYKQFSDHRNFENVNTSSSENETKFVETCNNNKVWTHKYKPRNRNEIIGNSSAVTTLFNWLKQWKIESEKSAENPKSKKSSPESSDSDSDFEPDKNQSKKSRSKATYDEDESDDYICNTMLISGPPGIGKTATVYALAEELGFKVFEVNASSRRNGKQVTSQLQEVTQSKQVSRSSSDASSSIASFFAKTPSQTSSDQELVTESVGQRLTVEASSLLLFEDIDLIFQEDEGLLNAVSNFMNNAKRPIVITTNDKKFSLLNKLKGDYEEVDFCTPPSDLVAQHLQLISLAENMLIRCEGIEALVKYHNGDIRKAILSLEYGICTGGWNQERPVVNTNQSESDAKESVRESCQKNLSSDMRFNTDLPSLYAPSSCLQTQLGLPFFNTIAELVNKDIMDLDYILLQHLKNGIDLILDNGIKLLNFPHCQTNSDPLRTESQSKDHEKPNVGENCSRNQPKNCLCDKRKHHKSCATQKLLEPLSFFCDNISACDSLLGKNRKLVSGESFIAPGLCTDEISDDLSLFWRTDTDIHASIQGHNLFCTNRFIKRCVNSVNNKEPASSSNSCKLSTSYDECQVIVNNSLCGQSSLAKNSLYVQDEVRRSGAIPLTTFTNSRSKFLDYTPTIRSICKTESVRSSCNNKRSGRFLHYLDSISVELSSSTQQVLLKQFPKTDETLQ